MKHTLKWQTKTVENIPWLCTHTSGLVCMCARVCIRLKQARSTNFSIALCVFVCLCVYVYVPMCVLAQHEPILDTEALT